MTTSHTGRLDIVKLLKILGTSSRPVFYLSTLYYFIYFSLAVAEQEAREPSPTMAETQDDFRLTFEKSFPKGVLNPFYADVHWKTHEVFVATGEGKKLSSQQKLGVVEANGKLTFEPKIVKKWYDTPPSNGKENQMATTIGKDLNLLLRTPAEKANFAKCYKNVKSFRRQR
jgi:hypothetical protein